MESEQSATHSDTWDRKISVDVKVQADTLMKEWSECSRLMTWCGGQMIANMTFGITVLAALAVGGLKLRDLQSDHGRQFLLAVVALSSVVALWFVRVGTEQIWNLAQYWEVCLARAAEIEAKLQIDTELVVLLARNAQKARGTRGPDLESKETEPSGAFEALRNERWRRTKFGATASFQLFCYAAVSVIALLSFRAILTGGHAR